MAESNQILVGVQAQVPDRDNLMAPAYFANAKGERFFAKQFSYILVYVNFFHSI